MARPWNEWYGNVPSGAGTRPARRTATRAPRAPASRRAHAVGERGRDGERGQREHDRPPRPAPRRLRARGVRLRRELPGRVQVREQEVVGRRERHGAGHAASAARRPGAAASALGGDDDQSERRALPWLEPAHEQRAERARPRACASRASARAEQHQRHEEDRDRGHQVAPQVLAGPHLARDEVEGVLPRIAAPVAPRDDAGAGITANRTRTAPRAGRRRAATGGGRRRRAAAKLTTPPPASRAGRLSGTESPVSACSPPGDQEARVQERRGRRAAKSNRLPISTCSDASRIHVKYWSWSAASTPSAPVERRAPSSEARPARRGRGRRARPAQPARTSRARTEAVRRAAGARDAQRPAAAPSGGGGAGGSRLPPGGRPPGCRRSWHRPRRAARTYWARAGAAEDVRGGAGAAAARAMRAAPVAPSGRAATRPRQRRAQLLDPLAGRAYPLLPSRSSGRAGGRERGHVAGRHGASERRARRPGRRARRRARDHDGARPTGSRACACGTRSAPPGGRGARYTPMSASAATRRARRTAPSRR